MANVKNKKEMPQGKSAIAYISLVAAGCLAATLISHLLRDSMDTVMVAAIVASIVACVLNFIGDRVPLLEYLPFIGILVTLARVIIVEGFYVSNVLVGIDNQSFALSFIACVAFLLLSWLMSVIGIMIKKK